VQKQDFYTLYVWRVYRNIDKMARAPTLIGIFLDLAVRGGDHVLYCDRSLEMLVKPTATAELLSCSTLAAGIK
jgi:hypothetical protein